MRDLAKSCAQVFIYLIFISSVTVRVWVLGLGLGLGLDLIIPTSCKSHAASYLAIRHIWHDTGDDFVAVYDHYDDYWVQLLVRSFLLVFYSRHSRKTHFL